MSAIRFLLLAKYSRQLSGNHFLMKSPIAQNMAILVVEFSSGGYEIRKVFPKNQHTQRTLLNFENWIDKASKVFKNQSFKNQLFSSSHSPN